MIKIIWLNSSKVSETKIFIFKDFIFNFNNLYKYYKKKWSRDFTVVNKKLKEREN